MERYIVMHYLCSTCGSFWDAEGFDPCCGDPQCDTVNAHFAVYVGDVLVEQYEAPIAHSTADSVADTRRRHVGMGRR